MSFKTFDLDPTILEAIEYMGIQEPTPIQSLSIPHILKGKDVLACAQTGTGKTAAFLLPTLHHILQNGNEKTSTLIIVPTRELAQQIDQQIQGVAYFTSTESVAIYGGGDGTNWSQEKQALTSGANIIVATPGKIISHLNMGYVNFKNISHLILDEADRMLDIGFYEDIKNIISHLPKNKQTLMFSATMPDKVKTLARQILNDPVEVKTEISKPAEGIVQAAYLCHNKQKVALLNYLMQDKNEYESIIIFSSTKRMVSEIVRSIRKWEPKVKGISSDLDQREREEALISFRARKTRIIVATDVLSRGIDIKGIDLVINFDVPSDGEDYVHRIGRTARAKTTGIALTLINEDDMLKFHRIEKLIEREIKKLTIPSELGEGPTWKLPERKPNKGKRYFKKRR